MRAHSLWASFGYAVAGLRYVVTTQRNFRIHLAAGVAVFILGVGLHLSHIEFAILAGVVMAVLLAELLNTIIETAIDLVSPEFHPLAKIAKDVAAGAVLLMAVGAICIGVIIFAPHLAWPRALP